MPVTLKDLRESETLVRRARRRVADAEVLLRLRIDEAGAESERHSALVERYRTGEDEAG